MEVEHFVRSLEAEGFVDRATGVGCVERDGAEAAAAGLVEAELDEAFCKALAAMVGVDVHVEDVAAVVVGGIERMGRPFEEVEASGGDGFVVGFDDPAEVFTFGELAPYPRREVETHIAEGVAACLAHFGEHSVAMGCDEGSVVGGGGARGEHGGQYSHLA